VFKTIKRSDELTGIEAAFKRVENRSIAVQIEYWVNLVRFADNWNIGVLE
jgi:hypothetical protein